MSRRSEAPISITAPDDAAARANELWTEFIQGILADPTLLADVPNGATLVLLPEDDPELAARELGLGLRALMQGRDIYFRHVRSSATSSSQPGHSLANAE
jgi:hypothetical protein